jgi:exodeoxyribonuclease-1
VSFVIFDTETTGLNHGFDQIIHFGAVRTDTNLNEVERFEIRCRLLPHVVPHPDALCSNGLPISRLIDEGLPSHYDMVRSIRNKLLSWSPSIFVGFNSIRFDEEMLRHALFQTLHPAYLTSNHGNCRADVLGLVMAAATLSPTCLVVPRGPEGRPVYRLEGLAAANAITHASAHDAMSDTLATLELCRLVRQRSPELWQRFVRFSKKATAAEFVDSEDGFFLTDFFANEACHIPVVCIGRDPGQPNARLCLRLDGDLDRFSQMSDEALSVELSLKPSPVRRLRVNAAPTLTPLYDAPDLMLNGAIPEFIETAARTLKGDAALCARIVAAYICGLKPFPRSSRIEEQLYDGFPGPDDEYRMSAFHDASWPDALSIVQTFDDERLRAFGLRLIYFGGRLVLPPAVRMEIEQLLTDRLVDETVGGLTLERALQETDILSASGRPDLEVLLADYRTYLSDRISRVTQFRANNFHTS